MIVGTVARFVVGLHVTGLGHATASRDGRPIFVNVMRYPFTVRLAACIALPPVIAPGDLEGVDDFFTCITGNALFLEIMPLEHTVGRNPVVEFQRQ